MKRTPILQYPYKHSPATWIVCVIAAILTGIFGYATVDAAVYYRDPVPGVLGILFLASSAYYTVQAYLWFRDRHIARQEHELDATYEAEDLQDMKQTLKKAFRRNKGRG
jgi:hypothetical protein